MSSPKPGDPIPGGRRRIDRILDRSFIMDLPRLTLAELRDRRGQAMDEEADLSYVRRMLQGRIDILTDGLGSGVKGTQELVEGLTQTLTGSGPRSSGSARRLTSESGGTGARRRRAERLMTDVGLSDPATMTKAKAEAALLLLRAEERDVSSVRNKVHEVIDALSAELGRRYRSGEAYPTS
ncbi:MAG: aerial mycelium formation protein [Candidatus Nanopelagicales bacterium]|nr:aerial mycelium formation protein [Candidatus Nanopelagicales bacterium]